jgi:hypothetical protein
VSEKKDYDHRAPSPSTQPLPRIDGAEEVSETELDDLAGGGDFCVTWTRDPGLAS